MPSQPDQVFAPVGMCIYCGSMSTLTDEHIIPAGLNGNWILPSASCKICAQKTSAVESRVLNSIRDVCSGLRMNRSRRRTRHDTAPVMVTKDGREEKHKVPISDHPLIFPLPVYLRPEDYAKASKPTGIDVVGVKWLQYGKHPIELLGKLNVEEIRIVAPLYSNDFARLIAKIAYAYAIAQLGIENFEDVFILDSILGHRDEVGQFVFTYTAEELKTLNPNIIHRVNLKVTDISFETGVVGRAVEAHVQLFANSPSPRYLVLIGSLRQDAKLPTHSVRGTEPFPNRS